MICQCEYDSDGGSCIHCGKTVSEQEMETHGLMPRQNRPYGFPVSRDWEDVDCMATGCRYNISCKCAVPSRCKISAEGKCEGFEAPPVNLNRKLDGD